MRGVCYYLFYLNIYLPKLIIFTNSLSSSFGEITFLSLSTFYTRSLSLTGWGSGTGAAGKQELLNKYTYRSINLK